MRLRGGKGLVPAALAPVYRQLRKSFEDGKHEPGAADFYYGEMEMRRHADDIPRGERSLLTIYWALSGYGLRATRALGWLLAAMTLTMLLHDALGHTQKRHPHAQRRRPRGRQNRPRHHRPGPGQSHPGPLLHRLSTSHFEKSLRVVVNSVVFRACSRDPHHHRHLCKKMASRLTEPVLLGLAALAIRGRIKR